MTNELGHLEIIIMMAMANDAELFTIDFHRGVSRVSCVVFVNKRATPVNEDLEFGRIWVESFCFCFTLT